MDLTDSSIKAKLRRANKTDASHAFIFGDEEMSNKRVIVKSLLEDTEQVSMSIDECIDFELISGLFSRIIFDAFL